MEIPQRDDTDVSKKYATHASLETVAIIYHEDRI